VCIDCVVTKEEVAAYISGGYCTMIHRFDIPEYKLCFGGTICSGLVMCNLYYPIYSGLPTKVNPVHRQL